MQIKARVQAIHFSNDKQVTVQFQGLEESNGWSASGPATIEEAAEFPVGTVVEINVAIAE